MIFKARRAFVVKILLVLSVIPELRSHLERFAAPGPNGFVFVGV
jgi:hypothetical protein